MGPGWPKRRIITKHECDSLSVLAIENQLIQLGYSQKKWTPSGGQYFFKWPWGVGITDAPDAKIYVWRFFVNKKGRSTHRRLIGSSHGKWLSALFNPQDSDIAGE